MSATMDDPPEEKNTPHGPPQDKKPGATASDNRKLRNRLSQKAFRARQSVYVKELERRLEDASKSETDRNADLEKSNKFLRDQLLESHKKLGSLQVSLQAALTAVAGALGLQGQPTPPGSTSHTASPPPALESHDQESYVNTIEPIAEEDFIEVDKTIDPAYATEYIRRSTTTIVNSNVERLNPFNLPKDPSHSISALALGSPTYCNLQDTGPLLLPDSNVYRTNSTFSDHISSIEYLIRARRRSTGRELSYGNGHDASLLNSASFMISLFISMSWPGMTTFLNYTKAVDQLYKLTTWRMHPSERNYLDLAPNYRYTPLQMSCPHPALIDWIPYPSIRDKFLLYHSANPYLDHMIVELGNMYVVESNLSDLVLGFGNVPCYISVWDLVRSIYPYDCGKIPIVGNPNPASYNPFNTHLFPLPDSYSPGFNDNSSPKTIDMIPALPVSLPARSVDELFTSRDYALAVFKFLGMDHGVADFKLDPVFFANHPELYDPDVNLMATGIPLRPTVRAKVPVPVPLVKNILDQYEEAVQSTM